MRIAVFTVKFSVLLLPVLVAALFLAACGDDRDETAPALTLDPVASPLNQPAVVLTGTREAGAAIEVTVDTSAIPGVPELSDPDRWQVTVSGLVEGANTISITATDSPGNTHIIRTVIVFDATDPLVTLKTPDMDAEGVPLDANVVVTFSEPLQGDTVSEASFQLSIDGGAAVQAEVTYDGSTGEAMLNPIQDLLPGTRYAVLLSPADNAVTDLAGNHLAQEIWFFTTATVSQ